MSEDNLGSSQHLDGNLDFEVDSTGDIQASDGIEDLEKDLAFQMIIALSQFLGKTPTPETEADIKRVAYRVAAADVRVSSVARDRITVVWSNDAKQFDVELPITVETDEEHTLVFEV